MNFKELIPDYSGNINDLQLNSISPTADFTAEGKGMHIGRERLSYHMVRNRIMTRGDRNRGINLNQVDSS